MYIVVGLNADDLTLLTPIVKGLVKMVHVCEKYALEFNITFNPLGTGDFTSPRD